MKVNPKNVPGLAQLLARMEKRMALANYAESTILSYTRAIKRLSVKLGKTPDNVNEDELQEFLLHLKEKMSQSSWHAYLFGIRYVYVEVLEMPEMVDSLPRSKREQKLPVILSQEQLIELFGACKNLKHRCLFKLAYGTGMRMNELRMLRISDVDSDRMRIRVVQGKGRKDRDVVLPESVLGELRAYYLGARPQGYLFNGQKKGEPMAKRSIQHALGATLKRTQISKPVTMHSFRHAYACHSIEMGMDIITLQHLLGHAHLSTTLLYLRVAEAPTSGLFSPLDLCPH